MMMLSHGVDHAGLRRGREMMREQGGRVREGGVRAGGTVVGGEVNNAADGTS